MPRPNGDGNLSEADTRLFESGNFADATIVCGGRTWQVHKVILSSRCKWFKAAFYGNMKEAASGEVILHEQDAELVEVMLRFIYAKNVNIPKLSNGKGLPALCVRIFRVADFFMLEELKEEATQALKIHLKKMRFPPDAEYSKAECPLWITEILDAVADGCKDDSTEPVLAMLLEFVYKNCHKIFRFRNAATLLDNIPNGGKDGVKNEIICALAKEANKPKARLGLQILEAVNSLYEFYTAGDEECGQPVTAKISCLPSRVMANEHYIFKAIDAKTDMPREDLQWMVPSARRIKEMRSHPDSEIVLVRMKDDSAITAVFIRFEECGDARLYVERYCGANPAIKKVAAKTSFSMFDKMEDLDFS